MIATVLLVLATLSDSHTWMRLSLGARPTLREFREQCPLRFEIDVSALVRDMKRLTLYGPSKLHCEGVALSEVRLRAQHGSWSPVERKVVGGRGMVVLVETRVSVPPGENRWVRVRAALTRGDDVLVSGEERIEGEAGEVNWDDGIGLTHVPDNSLSPPVLRLELDVAPERESDKESSNSRLHRAAGFAVCRSSAKR